MSKRSWIILGSGIPLLALFALLGWASAKSGGQPGSLGVNTEFGQVAVDAKPAPEFSLELLRGGTVELAALRGKVVMVDFWSSWCPPCRQEAPVLAQVYREYGGRPVEFIGVDIWDRPEDALAYIQQYGIPYPNGVDTDGAILIDYGVTGIPEKIFIDRDGFIARKFVGPMNAVDLRAALDELLAQEPTPGR